MSVLCQSVVKVEPERGFMQSHREITLTIGTEDFGKVSEKMGRSGVDAKSTISLYSSNLNDRQTKERGTHQRKKEVAMSKILIVADDVDTCLTFEEILEDAGYSVKLLHTSAEVFKVLPKFVPNIVLVDMNVPGIANILTLSFIRRLSELRQTKIIVITQRSQIAESAKSFWRAEAILTKPLSPERLLETVSSCL